jgi:branched-chain amino acid transport system ATP-binding protein
MKVIDNIITGSFLRSKNYKEAIEIADDTLNFLGLYDKRDYLASDLSIPDLKRLEIAKVLATRPKILLLDEVMAGLNPTEADRAIEMIKRLRNEGLSVLFIEHNLKVVRALADHVLVIDYGLPIAEGTPTEVLANQKVIEAYLGAKKAEK